MYRLWVLVVANSLWDCVCLLLFCCVLQFLQFVNGIRNSTPSEVIEERIEILNSYFT